MTLAVSIRASRSSSTTTDWSDVVTVNPALPIPSPVRPGLQAVTYSPSDSWTTRSRVSPGLIFSASPTIRSPSSASR